MRSEVQRRGGREHRVRGTESLTAADSRGRRLTATEARVAELVATGATNGEVAAALGVSAKTVETHLTRVYRKLAVRSRTELAVLVAGRGISLRPNSAAK